MKFSNASMGLMNTRTCYLRRTVHAVLAIHLDPVLAIHLGPVHPIADRVRLS